MLIQGCNKFIPQRDKFIPEGISSWPNPTKSWLDAIFSYCNSPGTSQFAADAEWPYSDEANAAIRKEFGIPTKRPVKG